MQQPLAHLYFLTVLEDLLMSKFGLPNLIRTSQRIAKVYNFFLYFSTYEVFVYTAAIITHSPATNARLLLLLFKIPSLSLSLFFFFFFFVVVVVVVTNFRNNLCCYRLAGRRLCQKTSSSCTILRNRPWCRWSSRK